MKETEVRTDESGFSRRNFLKGAALVAAGAGAGLVGCSPSEAAEGETSDTPDSWDEEHDVIVVGGGVGLAAAIEAADNGADTILLEASDHTGGLWMTAGGSCTMGGGNSVQQRDGIEDDIDSWFEDEMFSCEYRGDAELMRMLCERGADTVQWMEDLGMIWSPISAGVLRPPVKRGLSPAQNPGVYEGGFGTPNSGLCWTQLWEKRLNELEVPMLLNHRMIRIFRDENGPVTGVEVETPEGTKKIKANKGVILCTGTWTDNERLSKAWDPRVVGENCYGDGGIPAEDLLLVNSAADGHIAAGEIGAALSDMSFTSYLYIFFGSRSYWGWGEDPIDWTTNADYAAGKGINRSDEFYQNAIIVHDGKRYFNEELGMKPDLPGRGSHSENPELPYTRMYLELPQPRNVWAIADATIAETLEWDLDQINNPNPRTGNMFDPACIAIADTIEDLASQMDMDVAVLKETIDTYNNAVDTGADAEFGRTSLPSKIETAPFYGLKASLIRHTQRNGLRVNTKSQVIELAGARDTSLTSIDDEPVIPRLYAAGELGNCLGYRRPHNSLGHYTTAARVAGENAAKEA